MKRSRTDDTTAEAPYGRPVVHSDAGIAITVESLELVTPPGKVRAIAWVKVGCGALAFVCGPWRIVAPAHGRPRVFPPSCRIDGAWTDAVRLDAALFRTAADAILEAYARAKYPHTAPAPLKASGGGA